MVLGKATFVAAQLAASVVVANRLRTGIGRRPALKSVPADSSDVTIVIPARNEAERIGDCIKSIHKYSPSTRILVINDESDDDTVDIAMLLGAQATDAYPIENKVGKPVALLTGLNKVTTKYVLFIDADVRFTGDVAGTLVKELEHFDIVSLSSKLIAKSPAAQALSASMVMTLVYRFGAVGVDQTNVDRVIGNGQCLMTRTTEFRATGSFSHVWHNMTDDIALLRMLARKTWKVGFLDGTNLIETEMYETAQETWTEWPRSLPMNDVTPATQRALDLVVLWLTMALPLWRVLLRRANWIDRILLIQRAAMSTAVSKSLGGGGIAATLASPLVDLPVIARITWTTIRPRRVWRGRDYSRPQSADQ